MKKPNQTLLRTLTAALLLSATVQASADVYRSRTVIVKPGPVYHAPYNRGYVATGNIIGSLIVADAIRDSNTNPETIVVTQPSTQMAGIPSYNSNGTTYYLIENQRYVLVNQNLVKVEG